MENNNIQQLILIVYIFLCSVTGMSSFLLFFLFQEKGKKFNKKMRWQLHACYFIFVLSLLIFSIMTIFDCLVR